ncbi:MAG: hypothetical protein ACREEV_00875, partial [Dongiaceae bacterium]
WLAPLLAGLALAVPLIVLTTGKRLSRFSARIGLLWTPEETEPPALLMRARELETSWRDALDSPRRALQRLAQAPSLLALHSAILSHHSDWQSDDAELLARARDKLALTGNPTALTNEETTALLFDRPFLEGLAAGYGLAEVARMGAAAEPLPKAA